MSTSHDVPKLTRRELEILEAVACGLAAKEVAQRLGISPRTVEIHLNHLRAKLRARNQAHMVAMAIVLGLISKTKILRDPGLDS